MARLGVAVGGLAAGALIGSAFGNPLLGARLGFGAGALLGSILFPPEQPDQVGPRLGELRVQAATYGQGIALHNGTNRLAGELIWVQGNAITEVVNEEEQGGKGMPTGPTVTTYEYFVTCAVAICLGAIDGISRVWADSKLIYDIGGAARIAAEIAAGGAVNAVSVAVAPGGEMHIYTGTETQEPDPHIASEKGTTATPAFRGVAYVVFHTLPLANFANRIPNFSFEVVKGGGLAYPFKDLLSNLASGVGNDRHLIDPYDPYIWNVSGANTIARWDLATLQLGIDRDFTGDLDALGNSITFDTPFALDERGNFYVSGTVAASTLPVYRIDKDTLALTGQVAIDASLNAANMIYRFWPGSPKRWLVFFVGNGIGVVDADTFTLVAKSSGLFSGTKRRLEIDPNGVIWVIYEVSAQAHVLRVVMETAASGAYPFILTVTNDVDITTAFGSATVTQLRFYNDEDVLLIGGGGASHIIAKFDRTSLAITIAISGLAANSAFAWERGPIHGRLFDLGASNTIKEIALATLTVVQSWSTTLWVSTDQPSGAGYIPLLNAFLVMRGTSPSGRNIFFLPRLDPLDITLASIIQDVCARAGLAAGQIDTTLVTDTLRGYTIGRPTTARAALESLLAGFRIDAAEVDGKLKFIPRGTASATTLIEDDLGAGEDKAADQKLVETIVQEVDLPERLNLRYIAWEAQYDEGVQHAKRVAEAVATRDEITLDLPAVLSDTLAKRLVERALYAAWAERTRLSFALTRKYLKFHPGDVITVVRGAASYVARIHKITEGVALAIEALSVEPATDVSTATGAAGTVSPQLLQLLSPTKLMLIDATLIRDEDNDSGFYLAGAPTVGNGIWPGFQIFRSTDNQSFIAWDAFGAAPDYGIATTKLATGTTFIFDRVNTLTIRMVKGSPTTAAEIDVLNGANAALLAAGDDWEVIQWTTAVDLTGGFWRLEGLARGMRGTEHLVASHAEGDRFIVLSAATLFRKVIASEVGLQRWYKAETIGALFSAVGALAFTNTARGLECYSPVQVTGTRDGSLNLTINWVRRTRVGGDVDWRDGVTTVPVNEASEAYEVEIMNGAVVVRTITGLSSPTASYTAAQQTTDFGSTQAAVAVRVYQISATNGRGTVAAATV